jgi:hypothetical protein
MIFLILTFLTISKEKENTMPFAHPTNDQIIHGIHMTWQIWLLTKYAVMGRRWILVSKVSTQKKCHIITISGNSLLFCLLKILRCKKFCSSGEPAAKVVLPIQSRVFDRVLKREAAAGSLFGWSLGGKVRKVSKVSKVSEVSEVSEVSKVSEFSGERKKEVIMNIEQGIANLEGREGGGQRTGDRRNQMTEYKVEIALLSLCSTLGPRP